MALGALEGEVELLVHHGPEREDAADRRLASTLASVAGALNAAAFYAVGFFSANMTGNVSSLSDHVATGRLKSGAIYLFVVAAFILGAFVSTLLINAGRRRGAAGVYALVILIEALGMAPLTMSGLWAGPTWRLPSMVLGLAFLMGLQNAVVTRISEARVRTTHVSGMATDIGIEFGLLFDHMRHPGSSETIQPVRRRLRLHAETMLSFLVGGVIGVALYQHIGVFLFAVAGVMLALISLYALYRQKKAPYVSSRPPLSNDL